MLRRIYLGRSSAGLIKIGIARDVPRRWNDIDRSTPGTRERPTFHLPVIGARALEKTLHALFYPFRYRHRGSGKTEWFRFPFPLDWIAVTVAVVVIILAHLLTWLFGLVALAAGGWMLAQIFF